MRSTGKPIKQLIYDVNEDSMIILPNVLADHECLPSNMIKHQINNDDLCHLREDKQAGTGPSRRHIQGSKIAKGLRSVNIHYSKIEKAKNMNRVAR